MSEDGGPADIRGHKRTSGSSATGAVWVGGGLDANKAILCEGVEDALAVLTVLTPEELRETAVAASVSAGRIGAVELPRGIHDLLLMQDRDAAGERAWEALQRRWETEDTGVDIMRAVPRAKDANDELLEHGPEALRERLQPWLGVPVFMMRLSADDDEAPWRRSQDELDRRMNEVRGELRRLVGDVIGLRYVETLPHGAWGQYADGLITLAVGEGTGDPASTLNHEIIHALRECGLIDDEEWGELERVARTEWLDHPALDIRGRWPGRGSRELVGEAICEAYRSWCADELPVPTGIEAIFGRIRRFIGDLRRWAGLGGIHSWEDIFESIRGGERHIKVEHLQRARAAMQRDINDNVPRNDEGMEPSRDGRVRGTDVRDMWRQRPWLADKPPVPVVGGFLPEGFPDSPYIPDTPAVAATPGNPSTPAIPGNWRTWQSKRREWARREYFEEIPRSSGPSQPQGIAVRNADSGMDIRIGMAGIDETLVGSDGTSHEDRQRILANLVELLETAVLYQTAPNTKGQGADCYHSFLAAMSSGGQVRTVRLVVRQSPGGTYFYAGSVPSRVAGIPVLPPGGGRAISGQTVTVAQLVDGVHYYNETEGKVSGPMVLGSSWSGLGARLRRRRHGKAAQAQPERPGRTGDDFGERSAGRLGQALRGGGRGRMQYPHRFPGEAYHPRSDGGSRAAGRVCPRRSGWQRRTCPGRATARMHAAWGTIVDFECVSIASGQRRRRILAASEGRSPREHPEYAEWIENAGLIREKGRTILAGERTGIVMATGAEGYREWVEGQVGRMEEYLREDAVRIEADAVRERWDAFRSAAEAEGVGPAYRDGFAELSRLAEGTASRADLPADMRGPVGAVLTAMFEERRTAALQWRNLIIREADMKDRSRLSHDGYPDWERYCLRSRGGRARPSSTMRGPRNCPTATAPWPGSGRPSKRRPHGAARTRRSTARSGCGGTGNTLGEMWPRTAGKSCCSCRTSICASSGRSSTEPSARICRRMGGSGPTTYARRSRNRHI